MDNLHGREFYHGFMKRHPELTERRANAIKRSRAAISEGVINEFFDHFEILSASIKPENNWNYDETNIRDSHRVNMVLVQSVLWIRTTFVRIRIRIQLQIRIRLLIWILSKKN